MEEENVAIYEKNQKLVFQVINDLTFIPEKVESEELYQIGRMALWQAVQTYNEDEIPIAFSTYCYLTIKHSVIDWLRSFGRTKRKDIPLEISQSYSNNLDNQVLYSSLIDTMRKFLSDRDVDIFIDKNINGMELKEMSVKYEVSRETLRKRINHVKEVMQKELKGEWDL